MNAKFKPREIARQAQNFTRSIRFRLTLWSVAILAVILLVFSVFVYFRQAHDLQMESQSQLQLQFQQLALRYRLGGLFNPEPETTRSLELPSSDSLLGVNQGLAVVNTEGQILQTSGHIDQTAVQQILATWQKSNHVPDPVIFSVSENSPAKQNQKTDYLYLLAPIFVEHQWAGILILSHPLDPDGQMPRLILTLLLGSLATLALALAGGYLLASRAMAPVRTITRTARGISETDLSQRLKLGTQDELGELANTFDQMLDRLQAAFERQRQFTADASHELRTPLTIVSLEADQALGRRRSSDEYERSLKVIKSENEYMSSLVNDLLTLARMDAGQTHMKFETLDLSDVTLEVVERLSSLAHRAGVEIQVGDLPEVPVQGDRQYLIQMLTNLIENAIKYAGGPGHHVRIETGREPTQVKLPNWARVEDDGPGIPAEHLQHLFDRFYRVDKARTHAEEDHSETGEAQSPDGSGLGLSIVQWIAHAHAGEVNVRSEPGQGAAFIVSLP